MGSQDLADDRGCDIFFSGESQGDRQRLFTGVGPSRSDQGGVVIGKTSACCYCMMFFAFISSADDGSLSISFDPLISSHDVARIGEVDRVTLPSFEQIEAFDWDRRRDEWTSCRLKTEVRRS